MFACEACGREVHGKKSGSCFRVCPHCLYDNQPFTTWVNPGDKENWERDQNPQERVIDDQPRDVLDQLIAAGVE